LLLESFFHGLSFEEEVGRLGRSPSATNFEGEANNLGRNPKCKQTSKEMLEVLGALTIGLGKFVAKGHEHDLQGEGMNGLCFVNATVSGLKVVALVDTGATHNFVSEWTTTTLHRKPEKSMAMFKVVNSIVKPITRVVHSAPLKVGEWFGSLDLTVAPLDDHTVILGKTFSSFPK
jgi:hypothetical protein